MPFPPTHQGGSGSSIGDFARFGVVTVSDRASDGRYEDLSGPAVVQFFEEAIESRCVFDWSSDRVWTICRSFRWEVLYRCIPDEQPEIEACLIDLVRAS